MAGNTSLRRVSAVSAISVAVCGGGCFQDTGPPTGLTATTPATTATTTTPDDSTSSSTGAPTMSAGASSSEGGITAGEPPEEVLAFRLSSLEIVDPHFVLLNQSEDPPTCSDVTSGLNAVVNKDVGGGDFNLLISFEELTLGAEMRLFEGECEDPGDGSRWTCERREGADQTLFETMQFAAGPCRDIDTAVFQPVNVPLLSDPPAPCVVTKTRDFSVAVSDSVGALFLRDAQLVASPDSLEEPTIISSGILYGFFPKTSAEDISIEIPLNGMPSLWSVIDVPQCEAAYPDQLPSVDTLEIGSIAQEGVWLAINFTAERVNYTP